MFHRVVGVANQDIFLREITVKGLYFVESNIYAACWAGLHTEFFYEWLSTE